MRYSNLSVNLDKRREKRFAITEGNQFAIKINKKKCKLIDLSKSGMQLIAPFCPNNRDLHVNFEKDSEVFKVRGCMHWLYHPSGSGNRFKIGISVTEACNTYYEIVDRFIRIHVKLFKL